MKLITLVLLTLLSVSCFAQERSRHKKFDKEKMEQYIPYITRSIGASFQSFNGLNGRVANLPQYSQLKDVAATLGLGWFKEMNRVISDAGFTIGSSMSRKKDEKSSTIRHIGFNANIGYDVLKNEKITLYPLVGLGAQAYQAVFYKDNSAIDFNDVLASPAVESSITPVRFNNAFLVYRAGIGVAFKSPGHPSNAIGLQAGYTGSFRKNAWKSSAGQLLGNAPQDRISQFYVSLVLTSKPWMMMKK
ncbi:MAG: hypothetical protein KF862_12730 [Chitinophagaceae bacterium]|nr:hypothetical protein [Chitinophagaceae bacterium]